MDTVCRYFDTVSQNRLQARVTGNVEILPSLVNPGHCSSIHTCMKDDFDVYNHKEMYNAVVSGGWETSWHRQRFPKSQN